MNVIEVDFCKGKEPDWKHLADDLEHAPCWLAWDDPVLKENDGDCRDGVCLPDIEAMVSLLQRIGIDRAAEHGGGTA
jgi:hypothetical protein